MNAVSGARPPERSELGRFEDRWSFLYAERAVVHRESNAITLTDDQGVTHVPAASLAALILGPGTRTTHAAMSLLGTCGVTVVWVGEQGVRYYAHGRSLSGSSVLAARQARLVSNVRTRAAVAREMYRMRFGDSDEVSQLTVSQLRGREGTRMRRLYREHAQRTGVSWSRRDFDPDNFEGSDPINQALTAAYTSLYGVSHAAIAALGCVPGLGFVHEGTDRAFVFDIADLYKADVAVPIAFDLTAEAPEDLPGEVRRAVRDAIVKQRLMKRIPADIKKLLGSNERDFGQADEGVQLWGESGLVQGGVNYSTDLIGES